MKIFILLQAMFMFFDVFCAESTQADVCDPYNGRIIKGEHFVSDKLLTSDDRWNYKNWNKHRKKQEAFVPNKNCIPIETQESLESKIEELDKTIDLIK